MSICHNHFIWNHMTLKLKYLETCNEIIIKNYSLSLNEAILTAGKVEDSDTMPLVLISKKNAVTHYLLPWVLSIKISRIWAFSLSAGLIPIKVYQRTTWKAIRVFLSHNIPKIIVNNFFKCNLLNGNIACNDNNLSMGASDSNLIQEFFNTVDHRTTGWKQLFIDNIPKNMGITKILTKNINCINTIQYVTLSKFVENNQKC